MAQLCMCGSALLWQWLEPLAWCISHLRSFVAAEINVKIMEAVAMVVQEEEELLCDHMDALQVWLTLQPCRARYCPIFARLLCVHAWPHVHCSDCV